MGRSGLAAAKFLSEQKARVRATDASEKKEVLENAGFLRNLGVIVETGRHTGPFITGSRLIVTSPGVSKESFPLKLAKRRRIPVISEVELASFFCPGLVAAVTGSNGKTTTCNLIHRILAQARRKNVLCGNVGYSFLNALPEVDGKTAVVLELSSFQLEDSPTFRPKVAVVLNISPNHLDRHKTLRSYVAAKEKIFKNQRPGDFLVLNFDDPAVRGMARRAKSKVIFFSRGTVCRAPRRIFLESSRIFIKGIGARDIVLTTSHFQLKGDHNLENIMAAVAVAALLKIPALQIQKALDSFKTLEHRIEPLGSVRGVEFFNDSKSTTVRSTTAAILAMRRPVILVAGGRDKGVNFDEIEGLVEQKAKRVVLYGEAREKIAACWRRFGRFQMEANFDKAVRLAFGLAAPGDALLLSPMCTSFDQFNSFEERGEAFKHIFEELKGEYGTDRKG